MVKIIYNQTYASNDSVLENYNSKKEIELKKNPFYHSDNSIIMIETMKLMSIEQLKERSRIK